MDACHWRSKVGEDSSILSASLSLQSSNQGLPDLRLSWSALLKVWSGYAGPPSPVAPVHCHSSAPMSPPTGSGGSSSMHILLQPTSSSLPSQAHSHPDVSSVSSPVSVSSVQCRPQLHVIRYTTLDCLARGSVSLTLAGQHSPENLPRLEDYSNVKLSAKQLGHSYKYICWRYLTIQNQQSHILAYNLLFAMHIFGRTKGIETIVNFSLDSTLVNLHWVPNMALSLFLFT